MTKGWKVYWVIVAATVANYLIMILWSLPKVSEMAGGGVPFDMRLGGYTFDDALDFLDVCFGIHVRDPFFHRNQVAGVSSNADRDIVGTDLHRR